MCRSEITRRELLRRGLGAAAGLAALPAGVSALAAGLPTAPAPNGPAPTSDLDVALAAARWIRRARIETKTGVAWPADPLKPSSVSMDLYNGMPGVVLFHLELFAATQDRVWLDEARRGANELIARLPALQQTGAAGLYEGLAGVGFVLEETHRATGEGKYRDAAKQAIAMIHSLATQTITGATWAEPSATNDIISGLAGIGLFLIWADRRIDDAPSRALALAAGRRLLEIGIPVPETGGTKWPVGASVKTLYPNFSHGTAGVGFFLAKLYRAAGDRSMYAAALSAAHYLEVVGNADGGGLKVFHHEPGGNDLYYLSWCHGPAGTSRLFQELAQLTGREKWRTLVDRSARAIIASGAPERESPGYWNNISQCCGNAGVGEFFVMLQRETPTPAYADMVRRVSANTLARATTEGDGLKWIQAENRVSPEAVVAQTGFMQGAAGVGTYYLHADGLAKGRAPLIHWPDSGVAEPCVVRSKSTRDMSDVAGAAPGPC